MSYTCANDKGPKEQSGTQKGLLENTILAVLLATTKKRKEWKKLRNLLESKEKKGRELSLQLEDVMQIAFPPNNP